jgi:hypothetical protein
MKSQSTQLGDKGVKKALLDVRIRRALGVTPKVLSP